MKVMIKVGQRCRTDSYLHIKLGCRLCKSKWTQLSHIRDHNTDLFPSITSTRSSAVAPGSRMATSALLILYSLKIALISSWSMLVRGTVFVIAMPPFSFLRTMTDGGLLLRRIPKPSSSDSMIFLSPRGLRTSRTMKMRLHVRATEK